MAPALCSFALLRSSLFSAIFRLFSLARVIGRDRNDRISTAFLPFVVPFDISLYRRRTRILRRRSALYSLPVHPVPPVLCLGTGLEIQ